MAFYAISVRQVADSLQIPPHDGHPCLWLILLAAKRIANLHRQVCAHAGRTTKTAAQVYTRAAVVFLLSFREASPRG